MKRNIAGVFAIAATFEITGRGLVLAGTITQGKVSVGDTIEFTANNSVRSRKIVGVEGFRNSQPDENNTGIIIQCENEQEIEELRLQWKPDGVIGLVYPPLAS